MSSRVVNVQLYYESLCPGCRDFITKDLYHVMNQTDLEKNINLTLVPYGNARIDKETKNITCQHGEEECHFNFYEGCMIAKGGQDQIHTFRAIHALESGNMTDEVVEESCKKFGLNFASVSACMKSDEAYELQKRFARMTEEARQGFEEKYVPWIVINDEHIDGDDFADILCKALDKDPSECRLTTGGGFLHSSPGVSFVG